MQTLGALNQRCEQCNVVLSGGQWACQLLAQRWMSAICNESTVVHNPQHICVFIHVCVVWVYAWCSRGQSQNTYACIKAQHETWCTYNHHACTYQCSTWAGTTMQYPDLDQVYTRPMHAPCDMTHGRDVINASDFIIVSWQEFVYRYNVANLAASRFFFGYLFCLL